MYIIYDLFFIPEFIFLFNLMLGFSALTFHLNYNNLKLSYSDLSKFFISFFAIILCNYIYALYQNLNIEISINDLLFRTRSSTLIELFSSIQTLLYMVCIYHIMVRYALKIKEFLILILLVVFSLHILVISTNLIMIYLAIELQALCFYVLIPMIKKDKISLEAALKYFILNSMSAALYILACIVLYYQYSVSNLEDLKVITVALLNTIKGDHLVLQEITEDVYNKLSRSHHITGELVTGQYYELLKVNNDIYTDYIGLYFAGSLFIIVFLFKIYSFPFHFWVAEIYERTHFMVTFFLATVPTLPNLFIFLKIYMSGFIFFNESYITLFLICGICSLILGTIEGLRQKWLRSLVACNSINASGFIVSFFLYPNIEMMQNIIFFVVVYQINTFGLFLIFSNILTRGTLHKPLAKFEPIRNLSELEGYARSNKYHSILIIIMLLASAGLPPSLTFFAKFNILVSLLEINEYLLFFIIILTTLILFFNYIRITKLIFFEKRKNILLADEKFVPVFFLVVICLMNGLLFAKLEFINILCEHISYSLYK